MFVTAVTVGVGVVLLEFVVNGAYSGLFSSTFVNLLKAFHVEEARAIELYWSLIGNNKIFFSILGFLMLFAVFFYISLSRLTKYLDQIGNGINNILEESSEPVHIALELQPIEAQLNEIKATLKRQERESLETEQKKNDLVVFLAHDLKTPLTSIVAYLSMLESSPDMPIKERAKYTQISLEKALRLGELIDEFFEITRFNLQDITLEMSEWNLSRMLEQLADECYGVLRDKGLTCTLRTEDNLIVCADADKLVRVFENLLRNAISYCYPNTEIKIEAYKEDKNIKLIFSNQGETIPPHKLRMIFEKFYRADESRGSQTGGAGLGLAISKDIVELHHGSIHAESENSQTKFVVVLPGKETEIKDEVPTSSRRTPRSKARGRKKVQ